MADRPRPHPVGELIDGLDPIVPAPGSPEAVAQGCRCAVIDNAHGKGLRGGPARVAGQTMYAVSGECDLHRCWEPTHHG